MPTVEIEVKNSDVNDNFVTIRDRNRAGSPVVSGWSERRLNGGGSAGASLELDGSGLAKVRWTATRTDDSSETETKDEEKYEGGIIFVSSL